MNHPTTPRNICIIKQSLSAIGGLEKQTKIIAKSFAEHGHFVTILTSDMKAQCDSHRLVKMPLSSSYRALRSFDKSCAKHLNTHEYDIVFSMERTTMQTHMRAGNGCHKAYLQYLKPTQSSLKTFTRLFSSKHLNILDLEKKGFENPNLQALITNSQMVKDEILTHYNVDENRIHVIHNGVEWRAMEKAFSHWEQQKPIYLKKHLLSADVFHFLFVGSGFKRKGLDILLQALAKLKHRNFHLSVVGKDKHLKSYQALCKRLHLSKKVTFYGEYIHPIEFYTIADAVVIPSIYDPFANVTVEALAMGCFVISSPQNGGKEVLQPHSGKVIKNLYNISDLVEAFEIAMQNGKTLKSSLAIRESIKHLDFNSQINQLLNICLYSDTKLSPF